MDEQVAYSMETTVPYPGNPVTESRNDSEAFGLTKDASTSGRLSSASNRNASATVGGVRSTVAQLNDQASYHGDPSPKSQGSVCVLLSSEAHFFRSNVQDETNNEASSRNYVAEAGVSLDALLAAHDAAVSCGYTLSFVTVSGNPPPISSFPDVESLKSSLLRRSRGASPLVSEQEEALIRLIQTPQRLRSASADDFVCLLVPHHLGACLDLMRSASTAAFLDAFRRQNKPIGAIGYGVCAFFAKKQNCEAAASFFRNYTIAVAPLVEEARYPYFGLLPLHLQLQLEADGAKICSFSSNSEWKNETTHSSSLIIDRNLVTAVADTSTRLVTLTILMLCRAQCRNAVGAVSACASEL